MCHRLRFQQIENLVKIMVLKLFFRNIRKVHSSSI